MNLHDKIHLGWKDYENNRSIIISKIRELVGNDVELNIFEDDIILTFHLPIDSSLIKEIDNLIGSNCLIRSFYNQNGSYIRLYYSYHNDKEENQTTFDDFK